MRTPRNSGSALRRLAGLACAVLLAAPVAHGAGGGKASVERRLRMMGTTLTMRIEADSRPAALAASESAVRALSAVEARLSTWQAGSELSRLNRHPVGAPLELSAELARDLSFARSCRLATDGAFDPGIGDLVEAWDLRGAGRVPTPERRDAALLAHGMDSLQQDGTNAVRRHEGLLIEEGGFGKGIGLDAAVAALVRSGATRAMLDLGGEVAWLDDGTHRPLGVADPDDRGRQVLALSLDRGAVATSGNSERSIVVDGVAHGHLLDPRTGMPALDFGSLTVWAPTAATADCLSTGLYVMGPDAALAWASRRPEIEILVLEPEPDGGLRARATHGLAGRIRPVEAGVRIEYAETAAAHDDEEQTPAGETARIDELERRIEILAAEIEKLRVGDAAVQADVSSHGLGPAASKVYRSDKGVSIGGYGELLYENFSGTLDDGSSSAAVDRFDLLRAVFYFGYKFNDRWLFNSEIEYEHASTGEDGSVSVEFAYVDYLARPVVNFRAGLLLLPMGFLNELHEPTVFMGSLRPAVEQQIIPTTWRENGIGVFGEAGALSYRSYLVNGLDATGFSSEGLRGGRQKGSKAKAEDLAWVGRLDWEGVPGLLLGGSAYLGNSGQDLVDVTGAPIDVSTRIFEGHAEWRWRGLRLRALGVRSDLGDVADLNAALGLTGSESIGERLVGGYFEAGYDLFTAARWGSQSLIPYVRWESYDTQDRVPDGYERDPALSVQSLTLGVAYQPIDQVIFKLDYLDRDNDAGTAQDQFNVSMGYIF